MFTALSRVHAAARPARTSVMCGIAGFIDPTLSKPEAQARLAGMLELIAHRGPDGSGVHVKAPVALGMRRLSIIDLEGGTQPIWNEGRTVGVVFNGEIYNFTELTRELTLRGHQFRTRSDTEVLVHLYEEHGAAMFAKLRGMFAFAILDTLQERLFLARDHFGQKPLYYTGNGERFAFASELKCLLALPWVKRDHDPEAFLDYVSWLSLPPPRTHFASIWKLAPGSFMQVPLAYSGSATPRKYWSYDLDTAPDLADLDASVEGLDSALRDSVRLHLRADVPVGVLLSGGLDSRTVVTYAQELHGGRIKTFTVGFGGDDSELESAAQTAREVKSEHHALELGSADLAAEINRVAWLLDEPVGDPAAFAVLRVCELARGHVKVLLSGEGADELLAGYDSRYIGMRRTLERSDQLRRFASLLPEGNPGATPTRFQRLLDRAHHTHGSEIVGLRVEGLPGDVREPRGLTSVQRRRLRRRMDTIADQMHRPQRDRLSELLTLDLDWQLAESLLQKADKMSMGASIELRTPLLDREIAALAARFSSNLKLPIGGPGKLVLRHCLARKLNEPLDRPKKGFPVPLTAWFRGALREDVEETLFASDSACLQHLDGKLLREAWRDFQSGAWDGARPIYALWLYEVWNRALKK